MMNAELARSLTVNNRPVPDSYIVERALGDGQRQIQLHDIDALSSRIRAKIVLVPSIERDDAGNIKIKVDSYRKSSNAASIDAAAPAQTISLSRNYTDSPTPVDAFENLIPELLAALGVGSSEQSTSVTSENILTLPATPEMLGSAEAGNPVSNAARLCFMGELAPTGMRDSERLFERCLLLARQAPDGARQRFLVALAMLKLNLRTAAVQVLKSQRAPSVIALRAIVDGNLNGTANLVTKTTGYERLILEFEVHDLSLVYGHVGDAELPLPPGLAGLSDRNESWATLVRLRWSNLTRAVQDNIPLKQLLDVAFPIADQSLKDILAARQATPGAGLSALDLQLMAHDHVRNLLIDRGLTLCCSASQGAPTPWDYVTLIESWSDANLFRSADYQLTFLGLPERAQSLLSALDPIYSGRPEFEVVQAQTANAMAAALPQSQKSSFTSAARRHAQLALLEAGGQTVDAIDALSILGGDDPTVMEIARVYREDYPFNSYWLNNDFAVDRAMRVSLERVALASTQIGVGIASHLLQDTGENGRKEVRTALAGRFSGSPQLEQILEQLEPPSVDVETAISRMRKQVAENPNVFETRELLAYTFVNLGKYAEAAQLVASFPEFAKRNVANGVELSNLPGGVARSLYWHGAVQQARELYSIGAKYHVGSEAEMIANLRLQVLDANFEGALAAAALWSNAIHMAILIAIICLYSICWGARKRRGACSIW